MIYSGLVGRMQDVYRTTCMHAHDLWLCMQCILTCRSTLIRADAIEKLMYVDIFEKRTDAQPPPPPPKRLVNFRVQENIDNYRMSHDRWHAFNQSEVLNAVQYSVVFPFTGVRCTQRASIGYWPGPISNTGPLSTPYTRKGKQLLQARFHTPSNIPQRIFPKEMDAFIDDEDVGYLDALLDVPDFDVDSLFAAHVETEQEVQRHSRLIDDAVAEAQVEPADVRQFELSSTVRFRTGSSDKVYEKSIGSRFDKVSDDDIEKIIAEQKNRNTKDATDKWLRVFCHKPQHQS